MGQKEANVNTKTNTYMDLSRKILLELMGCLNCLRSSDLFLCSVTPVIRGAERSFKT